MNEENKESQLGEELEDIFEEDNSFEEEKRKTILYVHQRGEELFNKVFGNIKEHGEIRYDHSDLSLDENSTLTRKEFSDFFFVFTNYYLKHLSPYNGYELFVDKCFYIYHDDTLFEISIIQTVDRPHTLREVDRVPEAVPDNEIGTLEGYLQYLESLKNVVTELNELD